MLVTALIVGESFAYDVSSQIAGKMTAGTGHSRHVSSDVLHDHRKMLVM